MDQPNHRSLRHHPTINRHRVPCYRANRRPKSVERHEMALKTLNQMFAGQRLNDINPLAIERYKQMRKQKGRSEVTINREMAFLKNMFTMAVKWGKVKENPAKQVKSFREGNGRTRFLTEEEVTRLMDQCGPLSSRLS